MVSKLILGRNKKISLFNSTRIDFGYFYINYTSKSNFDQYYPNINHFSNQIIKYKLIYFKTNSNQINHNKINSI